MHYSDGKHSWGTHKTVVGPKYTLEGLEGICHDAPKLSAIAPVVARALNALRATIITLFSATLHSLERAWVSFSHASFVR